LAYYKKKPDTQAFVGNPQGTVLLNKIVGVEIVDSAKGSFDISTSQNRVFHLQSSGEGPDAQQWIKTLRKCIEKNDGAAGMVHGLLKINTGKTLGVLEKWEKRYFLLEEKKGGGGAVLKYWAKQEDTLAPPLGVIELSSVQNCAVAKDAPTYRFSLSQKNGKVVELEADSAWLSQHWVAKINARI